MSYVIEATTKFYIVNCAVCAMAFGIPERFERDRRQDHQCFTCPSGHTNYYDAETDEEKLKRQLVERDRLLAVKNTQLTDRAKAIDTLERSNRSIRAHAKRIKTKAAAGVCPVDSCKRHFTNLQRHIVSKHPSWKNEKGE